jgi:hypothetical protein
LPTKAHFSSNWTSRVRGGKSHEGVVELLGVVASPGAEAGDGVAMDADQAAGLADADAFGDVGQDRDGGVGREAGIEERGAFAFGEARPTGAAAQHAALPLGAVAGGDSEVAVAAFAIVGAAFVVAAESGEVVHDSQSPRKTGLVRHRGLLYKKAVVSTTLTGHDPTPRIRRKRSSSSSWPR